MWEKRGVILFNSQRLFSVIGCACDLERENDRDRKKVIKSAKKTKGKWCTGGFEKKKIRILQTEGAMSEKIRSYKY